MSSLEELTNILSKLPGLGPRSARRLVFYLLKNKKNLILEISKSLIEVNNNLVLCEICGNIDQKNPCNICCDELRNKKKICIVEEVSDLWAIEKSESFKGLYHVLGGVLSAIDGIGPDELNIENLNSRLKDLNVEEVILATNATTEGQITAQYIAEMLKNKEILITRLAQGLPLGSELDYIDEGTLSTAIKARSSF